MFAIRKKIIPFAVFLLLSNITTLPVACATNVESDTEKSLECFRAIDRNEFDKAMTLSNALIKRSPQSHNAYYVRARALCGKGKPLEALVDLKSASQLNPTFKPAAQYKGEILRACRNFRAAVAAFEYAFDLDPCDDRLILDLRPMYKQLNMDPKHYRESLNKNVLWKAVSLEKKGNSADALKIYNDYLKKFPKAHIAYEYRGNLYYFNKDYKNSLADKLKAVEIYPNDAGANASVASCYDALGNGDKACDYFEKSMIMAPKSQGFQYRYGTLLVKLKKYEKGIVLYTKVLKDESDNSDAFRGRGDCYFGLKKYKEALADYTDTIDSAVYPSPDTYKQRALVYDKLQQPAKAKQDRDKATEYLR